MKLSNENLRRVDLAWKALGATIEWNGDPLNSEILEEAVVDLLTNLMHFDDCYNVGIDHCIDLARQHYAIEKEEDGE